MQPFLHELVTCVRAPSTVLSGADGQIDAAAGPVTENGAHGLHWLDVRHLSRLSVTAGGVPPAAVGSTLLDASSARFTSAVMDAAPDLADPTVRIERHRETRADGFADTITVVNNSRHSVAIRVEVQAEADLAPLTAIKHGEPVTPLVPAADGGVATWVADGRQTTLHLESPPDAPAAIATSGATVAIMWQPELPPGQHATLRVIVVAVAPAAASWFQSGGRDHRSRIDVRSASPDFDRLIAQGLADLDALSLSDGDDRFTAAGTPWFLTLFGRDALWAARFALPFDPDLAGGTLRALARRQATTRDSDLAAAPGKILHEVRLTPSQFGEVSIPPLYYGTIDATPLWIGLLVDAWRWGLSTEIVDELLDPLDRALGWIYDERNDDGLLAYRDETGARLANQGWKDSGDSVQDSAGRLAVAPVTLCEVQAYAVAALEGAAELLEAHGRQGVERARRVAGEMVAAFRQRFWVDASDGRYPAIAIGGDGRLADSLTSNIGHLPGTGLLDCDETAEVARWLGDPRLADGFGVRTLDRDHPEFNPLGYHSGSIWPHDTAIAVGSLAASGHGDVAGELARRLVDATAAFSGRLPELFGGWPTDHGPPLAYPAACRPQAWTAAAPLAILRAALGLSADRVSGELRVAPDPGFAWLFPLVVSGIRVGDRVYDVTVDRSGAPTVTAADPA